MKFLWFGDSWVAGDELYNEVDGKTTEYTFAWQVSKHFGAEHINVSYNGSSIMSTVEQFKLVCDQLHPGDYVFVGLTSPDRILIKDGKTRDLALVHALDNFSGYEREKLLIKQWYKYFDSPEQQCYTNTNALDLLKSYCNQFGVHLCLFNLFTTKLNVNCLSVTDNDWIIPNDYCVALEILDVIDNEYYTVIESDREFLTVEQWEQQKLKVEKYIKPNWAHPNVAGHKKIANYLITQIEDKFNELRL